jgi:hypothetical protein
MREPFRDLCRNARSIGLLGPSYRSEAGGEPRLVFEIASIIQLDR